MKLISLFAIVLLLVGCDAQDRCIPCQTVNKKDGFMYYNNWDGALSHCIPCDGTKVKEGRLVCFGEK